jgi:hypothetical protein
MSEAKVLENWTVTAVALLMILVAPMQIASAGDWDGGHVEPNTTVTNTTVNTTIPQSVTSTHYFLAGCVLAFFLVMVAVIMAIRRS